MMSSQTIYFISKVMILHPEEFMLLIGNFLIIMRMKISLTKKRSEKLMLDKNNNILISSDKKYKIEYENIL